MPEVILGVRWWWNHVKWMFGLHDFTKGRMTLANGWHEVFIPTDCQPLKVMCCCTQRESPCCGGDICMYATCITQDGFILYADVKTNLCEIEWIAHYDDECGMSPDEIG